jgi:hypothetical protein
MKTNCEEIQNALIDGLEFMIDESELFDQRFEIKSFEDAGILSSDKGLVLKIGNQEFQITVTRSK